MAGSPGASAWHAQSYKKLCRPDNSQAKGQVARRWSCRTRARQTNIDLKNQRAFCSSLGDVFVQQRDHVSGNGVSLVMAASTDSPGNMRVVRRTRAPSLRFMRIES